MHKICIAIIFLLLLNGCSSTSSVKSDYRLDTNSSNGILLTSIRYSGGYSGYAVSFTNEQRSDFWTIEFGDGMALIPIPPKGDYSEFGKKGELFAIELPEGEYQIYNWRVSSGYATLSPVAPISIKFKIEPGKATYMGHFHFVQTDSLGLTVTGVRVDYSDNYQEDIRVLDTKYPYIEESNVAKGIEPDTLVTGLGGNPDATWDIPIFIMY